MSEKIDRIKKRLGRPKRWFSLVISAISVVWWAAGHGSTAQSVATWLAGLKPYVNTVWMYIRSVDSIWYQAALFVGGLGWFAYLVTHPDPPAPPAPVDEHALRVKAQEELEQVKRDRDAARREIERLAVARTKRTDFFYLGLCWELKPEFFYDDYRAILNPAIDTLDHLVIGPFCPKCRRPRKVEVRDRRSWMGDGPTYAIENPCGQCGHGIKETLGTTFEGYQRAVWTEGQRLIRIGVELPPCPHPRF